MAKYSGSGWHRQSIRHSNARKYGKAGGKYKGKYYAIFPKAPFSPNTIPIIIRSKESPIASNYKGFGFAEGGYKTKREAIRRINELGYPKYKKNYGETVPDAPLKEESTELPIQFSINVPSTKNIDEPISTKEFQERIDETKDFLSRTFGGDTEIKGKGDYTKDGRLIQDDVSVIESSMTPQAYKENKKKLEEYITEKHKEWTQDTLGFSFEDAFYIYPKFD